MSDVLLYTALIGDYDELKEHAHPRELSWCFTDSADLRSESWTIVRVDRNHASLDERIRVARFYKTHPHSVLRPHRHAVWIDASMQLLGPVAPMVAALGANSIATFKYPDIWGQRDCPYDEARACIARGKDAADVIAPQMQRYRDADFPRHRGLAETTIVIRENTPAIVALNELWWDEILCGSRRDQLSFDYSCWRRNLAYSWLPGHRLSNPFAAYVRHQQTVYPGHPYTADSDEARCTRSA